MKVHMWVEVTFKVFATVVLAYFYREMGIISRSRAERATYITVVLFFLAAVIVVGHNVYCIANLQVRLPSRDAFHNADLPPHHPHA